MSAISAKLLGVCGWELVVHSVALKQPKNIISLGVTLNVIKAVCILCCYDQALGLSFCVSRTYRSIYPCVYSY